jgi:hypothetical protein
MDGGQIKWVNFEMPGHSVFNAQRSPVVTAVSLPPDGAVIK